MAKQLKYFVTEDKDLSILYNQYNDYWWPGDERSQSLNSLKTSHTLP